MTPQEVVEAARRRYNSESSTFWSADELYKLIYEAELILATECLSIEGTDSSLSPVEGARAYNIPDGAFAVRRVEVNGSPLTRIDFRDDDSLTLNDPNTTTEGEPRYYTVWGGILYLRPLPSTGGIIKLYTYNLPEMLNFSGEEPVITLSTPIRCHSRLIDYLTAHMAFKDENYAAHDRMMARWEQFVAREKATAKKIRRGDSFAVVKSDEAMGWRFPGPS